MAIVVQDVRRTYGTASVIQLRHIGPANSPLQVDWHEAGFKVDLSQSELGVKWLDHIRVQ